jgi:CheY-like chemotaxis protein
MRSPSFLVIDDNPDSRFLLVRTLLRKFPSATIRESVDGVQSIALCRMHPPTAIIVHRTVEASGLMLIPELRAACPLTVIVAVSSIDRSDATLAAGADAFLLYDEWLRIGTVVTELIAARSTPTPSTESSAP